MMTVNHFQPSFAAKRLAGPSVQFSGIHPDAVIGMEVKIAGVQSAADNTGRLFFKLKNEGLLTKLPKGYQTRFPLILIREPYNQEDPNAIGIYSESDSNAIRRKIGYVPKELALNIAPLMDHGHQFEATLTHIQPYQKQDKWFHSMEMRLEYVTKPGRAPNRKTLEKVDQAFFDARRTQTYERVLTQLPEEINCYDLPEGKSVLVERIDMEQNTSSYYRAGHLLAKFRWNDKGVPKQIYERRNLPEPMKVEIQKHLNRHG